MDYETLSKKNMVSTLGDFCKTYNLFNVACMIYLDKKSKKFNVATMSYSSEERGYEEVVIVFTDGSCKGVNVNMDSHEAMFKDIVKALNNLNEEV